MGAKSSKSGDQASDHDLFDRIEAQIAPFERAYREKHAIPPGSPSARHLTDEELEILAAAYRRGLSRLGGMMREIDVIKRTIDAIDEFDPALDTASANRAEIAVLAERLMKSKNENAHAWGRAINNLIAKAEQPENLRLLSAIAEQMKRELL